MHHRALNPDHQGAGGLPGLKLTREINVCLADDMHGGSFVFIFFYVHLVIFLYYPICEVVICCFVIVLDIRRFLSSRWDFESHHGIMRVVEVSVLSSAYI